MAITKISVQILGLLYNLLYFLSKTRYSIIYIVFWE